MLLLDATNNVIGGIEPGQGNIIANTQRNAGGSTNSAQFAGGSGIAILETSINNTIRGNSIYSNEGLGIDIVPNDELVASTFGPKPKNAVTFNDPGDSDVALNYPIITSARLDGANLVISGFSPANATVDFYAAEVDPESIYTDPHWRVINTTPPAGWDSDAAFDDSDTAGWAAATDLAIGTVAGRLVDRIWDGASSGQVFFRRTFTIPGVPTSGTLNLDSGGSTSVFHQRRGGARISPAALTSPHSFSKART